MFLFHIALSLALMTLIAGEYLYVWASRDKVSGTSLAKFIGLFVIIFSIANVICISYYGVKYWQEGYFQSPMAMHKMVGDGMSNMTMDTQTKSLKKQ